MHGDGEGSEVVGTLL